MEMEGLCINTKRMISMKLFNLTDEQEQTSDLLAELLLIIVGIILVILNFKINLSTCFLILGTWMACAGYKENGKRKAIKQLKEVYNINWKEK